MDARTIGIELLNPELSEAVEAQSQEEYAFKYTLHWFPKFADIYVAK